MKWTVWICTFAFLITASLTAGAATYYVDATGGSDSNNGTSQTTPWKTIAKLNGFKPSAGDSILFKRGQMWREMLTLKYSGTASAPVTYGAYGTGALPIICASNPASGWTSSGANVWRAAVSADPKQIWYVLPDGACQWGGRKNSTGELTAAYDWTWISGSLYVRSASNPATAYASVELATRDHCVVAYGNANVDYIRVQDLELRFSNHKLLSAGFFGLSYPSNDNWTIERIYAHHNGISGKNDMTGVDLHGYGHVLRNSTVSEAIGNGIYVGVGGNCIIEHNTSFNNHHHQIDVKSAPGYPCDNNVVRYNLLYEAGMAQNVFGILYSEPQTSNNTGGIFVGMATGTKLYGNIIYGTTDKGIQIGAGTTAPTANTEILNNVVHNARSYDYYLDCVDQVVVMKNNIAMGSGSLPLRVTNKANKTIDYNCYKWSGTLAGIASTYYRDWASYRNATGFDAHSMSVDPLFVNAAGHDYRLQATSPCLNAGTGVGISVDRAGTAIPQGAAPDIGCFEYIQGGGTPDTVKPVITLTGQASMTVETGTSFTDPGATATDDRDGDITARIVKSGTVNTAVIGTYTLSYNVSDTAGNAAATVTRTVRVVDTTKPVITLVGSASITIDQGTAYTDAGATARDNYDGDITSRIVKTGAVNTATPGVYTLTYNVSDAAGNAATAVTRTVIVQAVVVVDTTPPVITLNGAAAMTLTVGATFTDPGATAVDDRDGDISARIVKSGAVNTAAAGTYILTYSVSDAAGNAAAPKTRTVTVNAASTSTVTVVAPKTGSRLFVPAGATQVPLTMTAKCSTAAASVEYKLDGVPFGTATAAPYTVTTTLSLTQFTPGPHKLTATATFTGSTQTATGESTFTIVTIAAGDDVDQNGMPDAALSFLTNDGDTWIQRVQTASGWRVTGMTRFAQAPSDVPVTMLLENPASVTRSVKLTIPRTIIKGNEVAILAFNIAESVDALSTAAAANLKPEPADVRLATGGQYVGLNILTSSDNGASFLEMAAPFAAAVSFEMSGMTDASGAGLQRHDSHLLLDPTYGLGLGANAGAWDTANISGATATANSLKASLTAPGVFAPYVSATATNPLAITTASLPSAKVYFTYYNTKLAATGGTPPYKWSIASGALPTGFSLSAEGVITGRTSKTGTYTVTLRATDAAGKTAVKTFTITVRGLFG